MRCHVTHKWRGAPFHSVRSFLSYTEHHGQSPKVLAGKAEILWVHSQYIQLARQHLFGAQSAFTSFQTTYGIDLVVYILLQYFAGHFLTQFHAPDKRWDLSDPKWSDPIQVRPCFFTIRYTTNLVGIKRIQCIIWGFVATDQRGGYSVFAKKGDRSHHTHSIPN
jgi:hypothetical protein